MPAFVLQSYPLAPPRTDKAADGAIEMHGVISRKALLSLLKHRSAFTASATVGFATLSACCNHSRCAMPTCRLFVHIGQFVRSPPAR